jgi:hypothetical protein
MTSTKKQRAKNTPPEKRIADALGRKAVGWLREECVSRPFVRLVEVGCDPRELWNCLAAITIAWDIEGPQRMDVRARWKGEHNVVLFPLPPNTFKGEIGFSRKELKTVIRRLRQCADDLERLRVRTVARLLRDSSTPRRGPKVAFIPVDEARQPRLADCLSELPQLDQGQLARRLRLIALATETVCQELSFQGGPMPIYENTLNSLVDYVYRTTGKYFDPEISVLVAAARGTEYSVKAHTNWRERHSKSPS